MIVFVARASLQKRAPRAPIVAALRLTPRAGGCADNDGPASGALSQGMCKGLDYFSLDTYRDEPAAEVGAVKQALTPLFSTNRPPNPYEPRGQGIFLIPGLFWFMSSCKQPGGAGVAGTCTDDCLRAPFIRGFIGDGYSGNGRPNLQ